MTEFISPTDKNYDARAHALVRIGRDGIATENDAALNDYFAPSFRFHGPGAELSFEELKSFFAAMRRAFTGFACERREIVSRGDFVGARTSMSGTFENAFDASPIGPIQPNGAPMRLELINLFRYDSSSRLVEEWVQYDNLGFLRQLGIEMKPVRSA